jgi:1-acyl-sn-glycerol-3-phosphate acyltransferase
VMVSNHASHLDPLCLLSALPLKRLNQTYPAAAAEYFFKSLPRLLVSVLVFNAMPFHRSLRARKSLRMCRRLLAAPGNILILFPEGTRSTSGQLSSFKPGVGVLLAGTNVPVVPCFIDGARDALPKRAWLPAPWKIRCIIGAARTYEEFGHDKESLRRVCADLRLAVQQLERSPTHERAERERCVGGV